MARIFIRYELRPDILVFPGAHIEPLTDNAVHYFNVAAADISEEALIYICFTHNGQCWAARTKTYYASGKMAAVHCVPFNDNPSGKLMLLKDALLN